VARYKTAFSYQSKEFWIAASGIILTMLSGVLRQLLRYAGGASAGIQRMGYEEDDGAANCRDPKEEHIQIQLKSGSGDRGSYLSVIKNLRYNPGYV